MPDPSGPIIVHHTYELALSQLRIALSQATPGSIVWLIAPSGSGKSELRYSIMRELAGTPSAWPTGGLPLVSVRAVDTDRSKFNPKDFSLRLALSLREPDLRWLQPRGKVPDPDLIHTMLDVKAKSSEWNKMKVPTTEHQLRGEFERSAVHRGLKWLFVEEAAALLYTHRNQSSYNYMLGLMQMIETIGCVLVMVGTHHSEPLWSNIQDVKNRSIWTWFPRYDDKQDDHFPHFAGMVKAIGRRFPLESNDLLLANMDLLLLNGAGIFGPTHRYMMAADAVRQAAKATSITEAHLKAAGKTLRDQTSLWNDARAFDAIQHAQPNNDLSLVTSPEWVVRS